VEKIIQSLLTEKKRQDVSRSETFASHSLPFVSHSLPFVSHSLPFVSHSLPFVSHSLPFVSHSLPFVSHSLPFVSHSLPFVSRAETLHFKSDRFPKPVRFDDACCFSQDSHLFQIGQTKHLFLQKISF
jgi:hypothetical protein